MVKNKNTSSVLTTIRRNYNRMAGFYEWLAHPFEKKYKHRGVELLNPQPYHRYLEIGFGPGNMLIDLWKHSEGKATIYGIELAEKMVKQAERKIQKLPSNADIHLINQDFLTYNFEKQSFDGIYCSFVVELLPEQFITDFFNKCYELLKPGGKFVCVSLSDYKKTGVAKLYSFLHKAFPNLIDCRLISSHHYGQQSGFIINEREFYTLFDIPIELVCFKLEN